MIGADRNDDGWIVDGNGNIIDPEHPRAGEVKIDGVRFLPLSSAPAAEPPKWAVPGMIVSNAYNHLYGDEGIGKSAWAIHVAAEVTRTGRRVVWIATEEDITTMTRARLELAGADCSLLTVLAEDDDDFEQTTTTPGVIAEYAKNVADSEHPVALVVVDSINDLAPRMETGAVIQMLTAWNRASRAGGFATLGIAHTNADTSGSVRAAMGFSREYAKKARSVLLAVAQGESDLAVGVVKNNLLPRNQPALRYCLEPRLVDALGVKIPVAEYRGKYAVTVADLHADKIGDESTQPMSEADREEVNDDALTLLAALVGESTGLTREAAMKAAGLTDDKLKRAVRSLRKAGYVEQGVRQHDENGRLQPTRYIATEAGRNANSPGV